MFNIGKLAKSVDGVKDYLKTAFSEDKIKKITDFSDKASKLLNDAEEKKTLEKFTQVLENINCAADLLKANETLVKIAATGVLARMAYFMIAPIIDASRASDAATFRSNVELNLKILTAHSMQQSRLQAGNLILQLEQVLNREDLGQEKTEFFNRLGTEAKKVLEYTPTIDMDILGDLTNCFINGLYIDIGMNLLDSATPISPTKHALNAVIRQNMQSWPAHDARQLTYAKILELYDPAQVNALMREIASLFASNGGDSYYHEILTFDRGNYEITFSDFITAVLKKRENPAAIQLNRHGTNMLDVWDIARDKIRSAFTDEVSDDIVLVITHRALLEYCKNTSVFLRFPFNFKNSTKAALSWSWGNCTSPLQTLTGMLKCMSISGTAEEQSQAQVDAVKRMTGRPLAFTMECCFTAAPVVIPAAWKMGAFAAAKAHTARLLSTAAVGAGLVATHQVNERAKMKVD